MINPDKNIKFRIIPNEEVNGKYDLVADDGDRFYTVETMIGKMAAKKSLAMAERLALLCGKTVIA